MIKKRGVVSELLKRLKSKYSGIPKTNIEDLRGTWATDVYEKSTSGIHNLSYWYPKVKDIGYSVPDTVVMPLSFDRFRWLSEDYPYKEEDIASFTEEIKVYLKKVGFNTNRPLFIKTGIYSGEFTFEWCKVDNIDDIGDKFANIYYDSMAVGAGKGSELVVREYIKAEEERLKIYKGLPLNTEFRVFYDFNTKRVLGIFNYWDTTVMLDSLNPKNRGVIDEEQASISLSDYTDFKESVDVLESEYARLRDGLILSVEENMCDVALDDKWSIDFMYVDGEMYLIDMALARKSKKRCKAVTKVKHNEE